MESKFLLMFNGFQLMFIEFPPRRAAAFGSPRRDSPACACGWELNVGTGLPPQTPPDFLFVIYKVDVVGVYCSHTPEESADNCYSK